MAAQQDQSKTYLVIGALLLVYIAGNKIFQKIGLTKSPEQQAKDLQQQQSYQAQLTEQYFDPDYYKSRKKLFTVMLITPASAQALALTIYNAKGIFNDDEAAVYGAFKQLNYKTQVSYLAETFYNLYRVDLKSYLQSFLNRDQFGNVLNICNLMKEGISTDRGVTYK